MNKPKVDPEALSYAKDFIGTTRVLETCPINSDSSDIDFEIAMVESKKLNKIFHENPLLVFEKLKKIEKINSRRASLISVRIIEQIVRDRLGIGDSSVDGAYFSYKITCSKNAQSVCPSTVNWDEVKFFSYIIINYVKNEFIQSNLAYMSQQNKDEKLNEIHQLLDTCQFSVYQNLDAQNTASKSGNCLYTISKPSGGSFEFLYGGGLNKEVIYEPRYSIPE